MLDQFMTQSFLYLLKTSENLSGDIERVHSYEMGQSQFDFHVLTF